MSNAPLSKNPPLCQGPDPQLRKPRQGIPAGAIDCHCHVFEDQTQYPLVAQRSYTPPLCTLADYLRMSEMLGVTRMVQVNASTYGFDNTLTLDVIAKLGQKRALGVPNPNKCFVPASTCSRGSGLPVGDASTA